MSSDNIVKSGDEKSVAFTVHKAFELQRRNKSQTVSGRQRTKVDDQLRRLSVVLPYRFKQNLFLSSQFMAFSGSSRPFQPKQLWYGVKVCYGSGPVHYQFVCPKTPGLIDVSRNGKNFPALLCCQAGSYHGAAFQGALHHDDCSGKAADDSVSLGKIPCLAGISGIYFGKGKMVLLQFFIEFLIGYGKADIYTGSEYCGSLSAGSNATSVSS